MNSTDSRHCFQDVGGFFRISMDFAPLISMDCYKFLRIYRWICRPICRHVDRHINTSIHIYVCGNLVGSRPLSAVRLAFVVAFLAWLSLQPLQELRLSHSSLSFGSAAQHHIWTLWPVCWAFWTWWPVFQNGGLQVDALAATGLGPQLDSTPSRRSPSTADPATAEVATANGTSTQTLSAEPGGLFPDPPPSYPDTLQSLHRSAEPELTALRWGVPHLFHRARHLFGAGGGCRGHGEIHDHHGPRLLDQRVGQ